MTTILDPEKISALTELEKGYKLLSTNLVDFYNGLYPASLSKISHVIFNCILYNKIYKKKDAKGYNEDEDKRIFTNILIQPVDLIKRINPVKFVEDVNFENDICNLLKRLQELEDNNIFYIWRFKQPFTYIFVMERDIASWKYYNSKGCLFPKSLKKITRLAKSMIDTMILLEKQRGRDSSREEIEVSFGEFLNKLIDKMNPNVSIKLARWNNDSNIFTYTSSLMGELRKMENFKGWAYDDNFVKGLPEHIRKRVIKLHGGTTMENSELKNELVPKNENLVKIRVPRGTIKKTKHSSASVGESKVFVAEELEFKKCDPFENPQEFLKYYRSFMRLYNSATRFYQFHTELPQAALILDKLVKNGREGNLKFLKAWMRFYFANYLKGNNPFKEDKTSLKSFGATFELYNQSYIG